MSSPGWLVVVEPGEVWTAAVRATLRRAALGEPPLVARLAEAPDPHVIDRRASVFVAFAVRRDSAAAALAWLAQTREAPALSAAALISAAEFPAESDRRALSLAAMQAGACLAVDSARRLGPLVDTARRCLDLQERRIQRGLTPAQQAWRRLPWQAEPWRLG